MIYLATGRYAAPNWFDTAKRNFASDEARWLATTVDIVSCLLAFERFTSRGNTLRVAG